MNNSNLENASDLYVPGTLGEIYDLLGSMVLSAPTFTDPSFPNRDLNNRFLQLTLGFDAVRTKIGEDHYNVLTNLSLRAKVLFEHDQNDSNGKTDEGRTILFQIEELIGKLLI
ncbi:hypothetical protein J2W22_002433 [Sphingomonas kyeonggiensis]|uniref:hypothetical protein n=1 Tax=Sphingomonas kyeonggiensis TaxID=1268553 RepID=UPI00277F619A|nr:hypothetical protein [Sphingomonas kyeonggiensis]MDQ0250369.1 hypothetical protein [Sphingomonas kyeonggiensis]